MVHSRVRADGSRHSYYRARYYDPVRGRFAGEDPLGYVAGVNFYAYSHQNPLIFRDPLGLDTQVCHRPLNGMPSETHTYLYSTDVGQGWGLGPKSSSPISMARMPFMCVPGTIENDAPYDASGKLKSGHQCTQTEKSACVERCVVRKATEATKQPPRYCLGSYQCQDWAEETLRTCRAECRK